MKVLDDPIRRSVVSGITVIVPVFRYWEMVHRTVAAVAHDCRALDVPWELIMVDNDSGEEFIAQATRFTTMNTRARLIRRTGLGGSNFQPGAARNLGIEHARHSSLIFLDADCIPAEGAIAAYHASVTIDRRTVFIGHREFVSVSGLKAEEIAVHRYVLEGLERVKSVSNYGERVDRRMRELVHLNRHERPYDCMYACNMACHAACIDDFRFDPMFDGRWGYEDIELGYRLHVAKRRFAYLPSAYVFHQEQPWQSHEERVIGRRENFRLASERIPGFVEYRNSHPRTGASPRREPDGLGTSG